MDEAPTADGRFVPANHRRQGTAIENRSDIGINVGTSPITATCVRPQRPAIGKAVMATAVVAIVIAAVFSALIALNHFSGSSSLITSEPGVTQRSSSSTFTASTETANT